MASLVSQTVTVPTENQTHGLLCYSIPLGKGRLGLSFGIGSHDFRVSVQGGSTPLRPRHPPAFPASRRLDKRERPLLLPAGKLPLVPLVDRPHDARDLGRVERGKTVQGKSLVLHVRDRPQLGLGHVVIARPAHKRAQRPEKAIVPPDCGLGDARHFPARWQIPYQLGQLKWRCTAPERLMRRLPGCAVNSPQSRCRPRRSTGKTHRRGRTDAAVARGEVSEQRFQADMDRFLDQDRDRALFGLAAQTGRLEALAAPLAARWISNIFTHTHRGTPAVPSPLPLYIRPAQHLPCWQYTKRLLNSRPRHNRLYRSLLGDSTLEPFSSLQ